MPRKRMIDPGIWQSEQFSARLTRDQRLLFIGIFSNADDAGRVKGSPRYLKMAIFPADEDVSSDDIKAWRDAIAAATDGEGLAPIRVYSLNGLEYIELPKWHRWQRIDKPSPSILPPFDDHSTNDPRPFDDHSRLSKVKRSKVRGSESSSVAGATMPAAENPRKTPRLSRDAEPVSQAFRAAGLRDPLTRAAERRYSDLLLGQGFAPEQMAECVSDIHAGRWGDAWIRDNCCLRTLYDRDRMSNWAEWVKAGRPVSRKEVSRNDGQHYSQREHI